MTDIVHFRTDDFAGFQLTGARLWAEQRCLPLELAAERELSLPSESAGLPFADFMTVSGVGMSGSTTFVVSERAWSALLDGQFGVHQLTNVEAPAGYLVVVVAAKLDVVDADRSVERFPGYYEGLHIHPVADQLAKRGVFTVVGANQSWLLCGSQWTDAYESLGLTGLSFEPAKVG